MCYGQCCHGDGSGVRHVHIKYHGHSLYYQATVLAIVINCLRLVMGGMCVQSITAICTIIRLLCWWYCLRLFVVVIYCYHGDGSNRRHVCTKYHGHTYM